MAEIKRINIMMAEDHNSARQAYIAMLAGERNFKVTGQAENGYELLKLIEKNEPDIVLTDLDMPVMNGSKLIEILKKKFPKVKVIVLSMHGGAEYISQLIIDGACAYIPKRCNFDELIYAINKVYAEGYYFNKLISQVIISSPQSVNTISRQLDLSPREIDILKLICNERSNSQIAELLDISVSTVMYHRQNIFRKTKSGSVIGLYKYALRKGIASPE